MAMRTGPRRRRQRGAGGVEVAVLAPVLLLLIMTVVQMALWQHAQHVVEAAAQRGLELARVEGGTDSSGAAAVRTAVERLGGQAVVDPQVALTRVPGGVQVQVDATAQSVVPFVHLSVHAVVLGPIEHVVAPPP